MSNVEWPTWPVDNALAILKEAHQRHSRYKNIPGTNKEANDAILHTLDFAIATVEGINQKTPPQPVPLNMLMRKTISTFVTGLADTLENVAYKLRDIDDWEFRD